MLKRIITILSFLFILSCSEKTSISILEKPRYWNMPQGIRKIKVGDIKGDTIRLREKIIREMERINSTINYFDINSDDYKVLLTGNVIVKDRDRTYYKQRHSPCVVHLYDCKRIGGRIFCKNRGRRISQHKLNQMLRTAFVNGDYFIYKNRLYRYDRVCPRERIRCDVRDIEIIANINIGNIKRVYRENYYADSCKNGSLESSSIVINRLSSRIARRIVEDIAPHYTYAEIPLIRQPDVNMHYADKKEFEEILELIKRNENPKKIEEKIKYLLSKYPNSQVLKYYLAIVYTRQGKYKEAREILKRINLKEKKNLEHYLERAWEYSVQ